MGCKVIAFEYETEDGEMVTGDLPARYEVCWRCGGEGSHVNPNVDGHGITADEWANEWDEDQRETYMSGGYDVSCEECGGARVTLALDDEAIASGSEELRDLHRAYMNQQDALAEMRAEEAAERRIGA